MRQGWIAMFAVVSGTAIIMSGCKSSGSDNTSSAVEAPSTQPTTPKYPPPPADSPFAKVQVGMGQQQVFDLIGHPTDTNTYETGKDWIPFYHGGDTYRTEAHYKGMGRIIFSQDSHYAADLRVLEIQYDPTETGYH